MPGPFEDFEPMVREGPIVASDPRPAPSWWDSTFASARLVEDDVSSVQERRLFRGFEELESTLVDLGYDRNTLRHAPILWGSSDPDKRVPDMDAIWRAVEDARGRDPDSFANIPKTRKEYEAWLLNRRGTRRQDEDLSARGRFGTNLIGGVAGGFTDPVNVLTLPIGAGGKTIAQVAAREAGLNALIEGLQQPILAENMARRGDHLTLTQAGENVLFAGIGGGVLGGAGKAASIYGPEAFRAMRDRAFPLDRRLASALQAIELDPAAPAPAAPLRGLIRVLDDDELAAAVRSSVPADMLTPDERAALNVLERQSEIDAASPFRPTIAGDMTHGQKLAAAIQALTDIDEPAARAVPRAVPREPAAVAELGRDAALRFVIDELEGGGRRVRDTGGLTRFGISERGNPDVDVQSLTRGQAEALYVSRYWEPLQLDRVPPDTALVAFDAAVNHGHGFAQRILRASGGDPVRMIELRRAEYARLVRDNPKKYGGYERGWENRLQRLEARLGAVGDRPVLERARFADDADYAAAQGRIDAEEGARLRETFLSRLERGEAQRWSDDWDGEPDAPRPWDVDPIEIPDAPLSDRAPDAQPSSAQRPGMDAPAQEIMALLPELREIVADRRTSLDPEKLARRLDVAEADARRALALLASGERSGLIIGASGKVRRAIQRRGPVDVVTFLGDRGGLVDIEGHDLAKGRGLQVMVSGSGPLFRKGGMTIDRAGEALWEAGYFGPPAVTKRPDTDQVIQLLERGRRQKVYRPDDASEVLDRAELSRMADAEPEIMGAIDNAIAGRDLEFDDGERAWIFGQTLEHGDIARAIDEAIADQANRAFAAALREVDDQGYEALEELIDDARRAREDDSGPAEAGGGQPVGGRNARSGATGPEQLSAGGETEGWWSDPSLIGEALGARFDDPNGEGAKLQADSLEHDLRMLAGEPATDPDIAARGAQRAALKAASPLRNEAEQDGTMGLGLFDAADQPQFRIDAEGDEISLPELLADLDEDEAMLKTIRQCLIPGGGGE